MRNSLVMCAVVVITASLSAVNASQIRPAADTNRPEALRHYRLGQDALRNEHFDAAEEEFTKASAIDPTLELAPYGLGKVYMATKRYREAIIAYGKCRDVFRANVVSAAGDQLTHDRRINDQILALQDQQRLYQQTPGRNANSSAVRANLAEIDRQIKAMSDSRLRTTTEAEPTPTWISIALGGAYFRADAMVDAEREYRAALAVDPKLGEAHNNLAVVCLLTGRYQEAEAEIKAAEAAGIKVNPKLKEDLKNASPRR